MMHVCLLKGFTCMAWITMNVFDLLMGKLVAHKKKIMPVMLVGVFRSPAEIHYASGPLGRGLSMGILSFTDSHIGFCDDRVRTSQGWYAWFFPWCVLVSSDTIQVLAILHIFFLCSHERDMDLFLQSRHTPRHVRDAVSGKTFPTFPAHEQPAVWRIWQEAHTWRIINAFF